MRGNNQTFSGYFMGAELFMSPRMHELIANHLLLIQDGVLRVVIDSVYPLSEAEQAHAYIESRKSFGRVLLAP
jgi:NADPH2:quinone reductase